MRSALRNFAKEDINDSLQARFDKPAQEQRNVHRY
jgi:hypothetical protein